MIPIKDNGQCHSDGFPPHIYYSGNGNLSNFISQSQHVYCLLKRPQIQLNSVGGKLKKISPGTNKRHESNSKQGSQERSRKGSIVNILALR